MSWLSTCSSLRLLDLSLNFLAYRRCLLLNLKLMHHSLVFLLLHSLSHSLSVLLLLHDALSFLLARSTVLRDNLGLVVERRIGINKVILLNLYLLKHLLKVVVSHVELIISVSGSKFLIDDGLMLMSIVCTFESLVSPFV